MRDFLPGTLWTALALTHAGLLSWGPWTFLDKSLSADTLLQTPTSQIGPSTQNLTHVLEEANKARDWSPIQRTIQGLHHREIDRFLDNFTNASAQEGWYAYRPTKKWQSMVVLPVSDLATLDQALQSPVPWIIDRIANGKPAQGPSNTELMVVQVNFKATGVPATFGWLAAASGAGFLALVALSVPIVL